MAGFTFLIAVAAQLVAAAAPSVRLADLDNRPVDPFQTGADTRAIVFVFTSIECPISNRYAPVVGRLHDTFASRGVRFWLIYPNPSDTSEAIRRHLEAFSYPVRALRDPDHVLAKLVKATVTPEAVVFDRQGRGVYQGRIDDRYVSVGVERPVPTRQDLEDALVATLAGRPPNQAKTQAVGCFIADFVR